MENKDRAIVETRDLANRPSKGLMLGAGLGLLLGLFVTSLYLTGAYSNG